MPHSNFFSSIFSTAHSASPIQFNKYKQTTCCALSPALDQIKGSSMHPLEPGLLRDTLLLRSDMRCWRYVDPAAKKSSIFTSTDCATDLLLRLSAACMSFDLPPLPSMVGGYTNELHQLYFAGHHGALVNSNNGFYLCGKSYGLDTRPTLFGFALLWPLLLLFLAAEGKSLREWMR